MAVRTRRALLVVSLLALTGCGSFRAMWRDMKNENLEGEPAPALTSDAWVLAYGVEEPDVDPSWRLLVFFLPT